ncbi:MAG: flagellar hook-length control protein FliK [Planctomycetaceae bacterium]
MLIVSSTANLLPATASTSDSPAGDSEAVESTGMNFRNELLQLLNPTVPQTELPPERINSDTEAPSDELLEGDSALAFLNVPFAPSKVPAAQVEVNLVAESGAVPLPTLQAATSVHSMAMQLPNGEFQRAELDIALTTGEFSSEFPSQLALEQMSEQATCEGDTNGMGEKTATTIAQVTAPNILPKSTEFGSEEAVEDVPHTAAASESEISKSTVISSGAEAVTRTGSAATESGATIRPGHHLDFATDGPVDASAARLTPTQREAIESTRGPGELNLRHGETSSGMANNNISINQTSAESPMTSNGIVATRSEDVAPADMAERIVSLAQETKAGDMQSVVLRLSPPAVGDVFVRISRQRLKLNIELRTHSVDVAASLRGENDQLMEQLVQQGFERESVDISYSGSERGTQDVPEEWFNMPRAQRGPNTEQHQKRTDDMSFVA